ncbi:RNA-directed DNA polymerase, eukaryota [Tanacetum coccineum]
MAASFHRSSYHSNEDHTLKISHSVYVTNFPDSINSRELWKTCSAYGTVVDVFIPFKKSKAGKRFAFVRFIKVNNLVENLCTIWIGRYHLYANQVRFERPQKPNFPPLNIKTGVPSKTFSSTGSRKPNGHAGSYANIVNGVSTSGVPGSLISPSPALVLDDSCLVERDLSKHAMGRVKVFTSIPNLQTILMDEGFSDVKLTYLGGMWVMFEFDKVETKENMMQHTGVNSWFHVLQDVVNDFVSDERIVWVDIEGIPLNAWSRETFIRIGKKWGETLDMEDNANSSFGSKRLCIKTKHAVSILESFKIVVKGKVFMVHAKELFTWNPTFLAHKEMEYSSDDESVHDSKKNNARSLPHDEESGDDNASEDDEVPETIFRANSSSPKNSSGEREKQQSDDPFQIYDLLKKKNCDTVIGDSESNVAKAFSSMFNAKVMNTSQDVPVEVNSEAEGQNVVNNRGSVLGVMEDIIRVGQAMGYAMEGSLGHKTKKEWIKALTNKYKLNVVAIQETKISNVSHMDVKFMWGNSNYDYVCSDSLGSSGGILCVWEASIFKKDYVTISDNFVAIYGTWLPSNSKILFVVIYAPQQASCKRILWDYVSSLLGRWNGEAIIMGDFNEVRSSDERRGSCFNPSSARRFDQFNSSSGLVDVKLEGYTFTWSHPSALKMSKLDHFLVSDGIFSLFPSITALCLDRHLSDHRPILLREVHLDFSPTPFRVYHSWFNFVGFDDMVEHTWRSFTHSDGNGMIRFKKKLQDLKIIMRRWVNDKRIHLSGSKREIVYELGVIDKDLDRGVVSDDCILRRLELTRQLHNINEMEAKDSIQKAKVKWAIKGDENSKFFHGIINKKRSQLAIRGVFVDGLWCTDPGMVKETFCNHFEARFKKHVTHRFKLNFHFHKKLLQGQVADLERCVSRDEIRMDVWSCGDNKSPGPDGITFEFFKKYWDFIGPDFCEAVEYFFVNGSFSKGCNSSFVALILKVMDAKFVNDFRPISLIGCVYKVNTKVLANRLASVIADLVSDTQSAFVAGRQILDGPFILNEILHWCKRKKKHAMFFKVDFAKAYDSVRWDYLLDVLEAFEFGSIWCKWIRGTFSFAKASILVNGSPSNEFSFHCGLRQGDHLSLYLFILVMESLHLSFLRVVDEGLFKGILLPGSISISHLFYADDAMFIGEWSDGNLRSILNILKCFFLASGLQINIHKSQVLGVGVPRHVVDQAASSIGCSIMQNQFRYLGVMVGECMSRHKAWADTVLKLRSRLSKWKVKTLSIGGRLTLLKSVLGASPLYSMSIFKVPRGVLKIMEAIRNRFFNGVDPLDKKIMWAAWDKVLTSNKNGGLGVSSFHALNRALLLKWVWRFVSQDCSLWFRVIRALYGSSIGSHLTHMSSNWCSIMRELHLLKDKGFDFRPHCKKRVGNGNDTRFWLDRWICDKPLSVNFPRLFALELNKDVSVAVKMDLVYHSFRRSVRDGLEQQLMVDLYTLLEAVSLSNLRINIGWICDIDGDGEFRVKEVRNYIDDMLLPSHSEPTR